MRLVSNNPNDTVGLNTSPLASFRATTFPPNSRTTRPPIRNATHRPLLPIAMLTANPPSGNPPADTATHQSSTRRCGMPGHRRTDGLIRQINDRTNRPRSPTHFYIVSPATAPRPTLRVLATSPTTLSDPQPPGFYRQSDWQNLNSVNL